MLRDRFAPTAQFLAFIWAGQDGWFEIDPAANQRRLMSREEAFAGIAGSRFFGPLARRAKGSRREHIAETGNVIWADVDSRDAPQRISERMAPLGLDPSVLVDSGNKGYWIYVKLTRCIPTDEIERLNRALRKLMDGDNCWARTQIARLPGSVNDKSGRRVEIVSFSGARYDPDFIVDALSPSAALDSASHYTNRPQSTAADLERGKRTTFGVVPPLPHTMRTYINQRPRKGEGYDRSLMEQQIFTLLVARGWSDDQIIAYADAHRLSKHTERRIKRGTYAWTTENLKAARKYQEKSSTTEVCMETVTPTRRQLDRVFVLTLVCGQRQCDLVREVVQRTGRHKRTVLRALKQLEEGGLLYRVRCGNTVTIHLTERGSAKTKGRYTITVWVPTLANVSGSSSTVRAWSSEASAVGVGSDADALPDPSETVQLAYRVDGSYAQATPEEEAA